MWYLGADSYMTNMDGPLGASNLIHQQSYEDADLFISLFENAIEQGYNPNDSLVQNEIFKQGVLGGFDQLMTFDQERVLRRVEEIYKSKN